MYTHVFPEPMRNMGRWSWTYGYISSHDLFFVVRNQLVDLGPCEDLNASTDGWNSKAISVLHPWSMAVICIYIFILPYIYIYIFILPYIYIYCYTYIYTYVAMYVYIYIISISDVCTLTPLFLGCWSPRDGEIPASRTSVVNFEQQSPRLWSPKTILKTSKSHQLDDGGPESVEEQSLLLLVWRHHITKQYIKDVL